MSVRHRLFGKILLFVGVGVFVCACVVLAQTSTDTEERTLYVFPAHITGATWNNIAGVYGQDVDTNGLLQDFTYENSAYLSINSHHDTEKAKGVTEEALSEEGDREHASTDNLIKEEGDTTLLQEVQEDTGMPSEPVEISETQSVPEAKPEPEEDSVSAPTEDVQTENEPSAQSTLFGAPFARLTEKMALFFGAVTEITTSTPIAENLPVETVIIPDIPSSTEPILHTVPGETSPVPEEDSDEQDVTTTAGSTTTTETLVSVAAKYFCEGEKGCETHELVFEGFDIPALDSGETIQDAQLRLSFAAKPRESRVVTREEGLLIEYTFDEVWHDAGVIPITEEVSNAINGGYFLYALPDITNIELLKQVKVRVSFIGAPEDMERIFIDSAWIQLGIETLSEKELRDHVLPDALEELEKPKMHELLSQEIDFTSSEMPQFTLKYHEQRNVIVRFFRGLFSARTADVLRATVQHEYVGEIDVTHYVHETNDGLWTLNIPEDERGQFLPGRYTLRVEVAEGSVVFKDELEFQWGLLAVNTHKSEYVVGETADISFAALSMNGNTQCDARLSAYIIRPDNFISRIPVSASGLCMGNTVVDKPDYTSSYMTQVPGTHTLYLESTDENGVVISHTEDTFEVVTFAPVSIERSAPIRIYPVSPYDMHITVSARQDFSGIFVEQVPMDYEVMLPVTDTEGTTSIQNGVKNITWPIALKKGETATFSYSFDSPDISPYLYLLGPATILLDEGQVFEQTIYAPSSTSTEVVLPADDKKETEVPPVPEIEHIESSISISIDDFFSETSEGTTSEEVLEISTEENLEQESETTAQSEIIPIVSDTVPTTSEVEPEALPLLQGVFIEGEESSSTTSPEEEEVIAQEEVMATTTETGKTTQELEEKNISFTEKRSWQIASDATGNMLLYWDGTAIPTGWTCVSCTGSDVFYQRFVVGSSTAGINGGAATHTHTATGVVNQDTGTGVSSTGGGGADTARFGHTHNLTPIISTTSNLPQYRNLVLIQYNSAGEPPSIPTGAIGLFDASVPSGWTQYAAQDGNYIRSESTSTVTTTGGSNTHTHTATGTTGVPSLTTNGPGNSGVSASTHLHTHTVSTTTVSINSEPPYIETILGKLNATSSASDSMIAMWTDTPPTAWNTVSSSSEPFANRFVKASTTYGGTGGASSHSHANITGIVSSGPSVTVSRTAGGTGNSMGTHTHLVDINSFSTTSHLPPYRTAIFAKRAPGGLPPDAPTLHGVLFESENTGTSTPSFEFTGSDPDGPDTLVYEFMWSTSSSMTSPLGDRTSDNETGCSPNCFQNTVTPADTHPFNELERMRFTIQTPLTSGETYYWRVRVKETIGDTWSSWSTTTSFTYTPGTSPSEWYQTQDAQFSLGTFSNTATSSHTVQLSTTTLSVPEIASGVTSSTIAAASSLVLTKPSGVEVGDLLLIFVGNDNTTNTAQWDNTTLKPTGFTLINEAGSATSDTHSAAFYRIADGTETATTSVSAQAVANYWGYYIRVVGASTTNPINVTGADYSVNNLTNHPITSVTTTNTNTLAFYLLSGDGGDTYPFNVSGTGWGENAEIRTGTTAADAAGTWGTRSMTSAGATGAATVAMSVSDGASGFQFALNPGTVRGTVMSSEIDFDSLPGRTQWGEVSLSVTEPTNTNSVFRVYYSSSTACDTIVPDSALAGNSTGFDSATAPLHISGLSTSTYNRICLQTTLIAGIGATSPILNDWTVRWTVSPQFTQSAYRWYANTNDITPTDPWPAGSTDLDENEAADAENTILPSAQIRLRMSLQGTSSAALANSTSFKLQYSAGDTCSANTDWYDVGEIGSTTALWRGYDNTGVSDAAALPSTVLTDSTVSGSYEEENASASNPNAIGIGAYAEWDWVLDNSAAVASVTYCFRMVKSNGAPLTSYTEYPTIVTNNNPTVPTLYTPFDNEKVASTSPYFEFVSNDSEGEELDYQVQISTSSSFVTTLIDTDSVSNLNDFLNTVTPADKTSFNNAERMRYSIPSSLASGTTYWWRVRAIDGLGSNSYSEWSNAQSVTIDPSISFTTWYQTTENQFDTDTLIGTDATVSNLVTFASGSTTGTTTSTAINFDDVTVGNSWGYLSFTETGAANDILYHLEYYDGNDWALIPDSALSGNAAGFDTSPVDLIDLNTSAYSIIRIRANFSAGSPTLLDWSIVWGERVSVPTLLSLFDNEKTGTTTPTFTFYSTDPQSQDLEYEISWSTDKSFSTGSTTKNSSSTPTGFVNTTTGGDTTSPFISGDTIAYTVQAANALSASTTYWWRVRAKDPTGSNSYSFWSDPWSFTTATSGESVAVSTWYQTTGLQFETGTLDNAATSTGAITVGGGITVQSGWTSTVAIPNSSITLTKPTGVSPGDLLLIFVGNDNTTGTAQWNNTTLKPTGFTLINTAGNATPDAHVAAFYRIADGTEGATIGVTAQSSANYWGFYLRVTGVDTVDPIDAIGTDYAINNSLNHAITSVTTTIDNALTFYLLSADGGDTYPFSVSAGWSEGAEIQAGTLGTNAAGTWGTRSVPTAGAAGAATVTMTVSDGAAAFQFAVTPESITGATVTSPAIDFDDGSGPAWGSLSWSDTEPGVSQALYHLEYLNSIGEWDLIPDADLPGNAAGFTSSPIILNTLNTTTYNEIRIVADLDCSGVNCPTINDWTVQWSAGFVVSGTAFEYNQTSSTTAGTVAVAVNGVLQSGKTGSISNGSWSISNVTFYLGDVVSVFITGTSTDNKAVAVTKYDGVPDISGMRLYKRHLSIGSDDMATITNTDLGLYDSSNNTDVFYDVNAGNDLTVCALSGCVDSELIILAANTYAPGTGADIVTHDMENNGTLTLSNTVMRVSGSWDDNATTTAGTSQIIFTATSTTEAIDQTGSLSGTFYDVTFGETSGTATWSLVSALTLSRNLEVTYGTLARDSLALTVAGNITTGANGFWTGIGTTTFDGTNPSTWTDQNTTKQDIGRLVVDGTAKTLFLGSNVTANSVTIGSDDVLDVSVSGHSLTVLHNWTNANTFTARTGTVIFAATTTNKVITQGTSNFYNLTFNGVGGSWSFVGSSLTVGNDFTVSTGTVTLPTGTTTVAGSWNSTGGLFAHNNGGVTFTAASAKTITLAGSNFTNTFYNLAFSGSGSWSFVSANATTSNDLFMTQGSVTFPSGVLALGGSLSNSGGTFAGNNGTLQLTAATAETLYANGSSFAHMRFSGSGSWSFVDTSVTALGDITLSAGTVTAPSGTWSLAGSFTNAATFTHNSGTVLFNATTTGKTITPGSSPFFNMTFNSTVGGWTISNHTDVSNNFTLTALSSFTMTSGRTLTINGVFTNSVGGASTTWTGSTLLLQGGGTYTINTKTTGSDAYAALQVGASTRVSMWNSSASAYTVDTSGYLYSADHNSVDGNLYIFGSYVRTSGTEHWSYATDFDGTALSGSSTRQAHVRFESGATATFSTSTLSIVGTSTASSTIDAQSGTYTITLSGATTTASYYAFSNLGSTGVTLGTSTKVTTLSDGSFTLTVNGGSGLTIASSTIDANPLLQIQRVVFATTTPIAATNVTQSPGTPSSYWWFRNSTGNLSGEAFDNDTGNPGSIRWDNSSLLITASGTVYADEAATPLGAPTCDGVTPVVTIVVDGGASYTGACNAGTGAYVISNIAITGAPVLTTYLNTNGGIRGATITKTPTQDIADLNIYAHRVITRHEDSLDPLTSADMAVFDETHDTDIPFDAATSTNALIVRPEIELHIASSTTFVPGGTVTLQSGGSGAIYDGRLHVDNGATFTGSGTTTYSIGGGLSVDTGATFSTASSTVVFTATTTGKSISTPAPQSITFNAVQFAGVGGGWSIDGTIISNGAIDVATGTVSGAGSITANSSFAGNGTVALTGGTTTVAYTNILGGSLPWTFYHLTLGNGSTVGTTTRASSATTTVSGVLTIATGHTLSMGSSHWNLAGAGTPLIISGTLSSGTGTVRYSGTSATNIVSATYYDLNLSASSGSPTYTAIGTGILVQGSLSVGAGATTTVTFDTNDTVLGVTGNVFIDSLGTLIGSNSGSFTVAGNWTNTGIFTHSAGTVSFTGSGAVSIAPGSSAFGSVNINGAGTFTVTGNATATNAFSLTSVGAFTQNSGTTLAVGGVFSNGVSGALTTWTGSILSLYGGSNYQINASTTGDTYATLRVEANTHIRTWNTSALSTVVDQTGSLYSQDNAGVDGALYVYGAYTKSSGTDYWSYATDFDGTALGGSSRAVTVSFAPNATATIAGGTLNIIGDANASTTLTNQGSGTYAFVVNAGTINAQHYRVRNSNASGLLLTGTPTITTLSYGDFEVGQNNGSALTVGSSVIDQNPAKTFTGNIFATSSSISSAFNVTATGTSLSSWRFTGHAGAIAGEAFDVDPGGDPGYIVWDDSAGTITISGTVYSDEGSTPIGGPTCDGSTTVVRVVVEGLTSYTGSCNAGSGAYSIGGVAYSPGDTLVVYLDTNGGAQAANVTVSPLSSIATMHLYQNRVIVRHEDTTPIAIADLATWDSSDDADVPFTATLGSPNTLTLPANKKLIVWNSKTFAPNGNVTLSGGGGGAVYDGTLELFSGASFTAAGTESHSVGGSLILGSSATITPAQATFTFTTSGSNRTIDTNNGSLYNATFNGSGSWSSSDTDFVVGNTLTITSGALTLPSGTTTIAGSLLNTGGSFNNASGTLYFTATSGGKTVRVNGSSMHRTTFNGTGGAWSFFDANATTSSDFLINAGTVTFPSGTLAVGGVFSNNGGAFTHNSGILKVIGTSLSTRLFTNGSSLNSLTVETTGGYAMADTNVTLLGTVRILQGALTFATGTVSIGGSLITTGGTFAHASGTILFNSTDTGESITPGNSTFYAVSLASAGGGWTITGNATTTGNFSLTSASQFTLASGTTLAVQGVFTNTVGGAATTWTGSTLAIDTGTNYTSNTSATPGERYETLRISSTTALRMWNSAATSTILSASSSLYSQDHAAVDGSLYIYGNYQRTSGSDYWSYATDFDGTALGGSSRAVTVSFAPNATATYSGASLAIVGTASATTTITNQGSGTYALVVDGSTLNAQYYAVRNANADGLQLSGLSTITSLGYGDFELGVSGGSLITLSSTTLNANASISIAGMRFATTTAITGVNVELVGSTPSAWTFTSHTGNLAGESFDTDGVDACGSLRWTDSVCLITEQTHYRWRNDNGGESVPDSEWYNVSWSKRKRVTITNVDATTYTNAVVKVPLTYDADMQTDFDDIRFTDAGGTTSIPYWIETYTGSASATVWVKVPSLAASAVTSVFVYYGNGAATDGSTGSTTFSVFDDFEDGNISEYSGDTSLFQTGASTVYERTKRLEASNVNGRTTVGLYNTSVSVAQGQTVRYFQYIDTAGGGSSDEVCTLFGVQTPGTDKHNYAVCLEVFGTDHISLAKDVYDRDNNTNTTVLASTTLTFTTGWYEVEARWSTTNTIAVTVSKGGSVVATTSATDSSYTTGGIGYTFWSQHGGWDMYTSRPLLTTEPTVGFGVEQVPGGATWYAALDTTASGIVASTTQRLRLVVENSGLTITDQQYRLEYAIKGAAPSCESVSGSNYAQVPVQASCGTSPICMQSSSFYTNQASTTDLLTGDGTFTYGQIIEDPSNKTGGLTLTANQYTELEYAFAPTIYASSTSYCFRVSNDGAALDSYAKVAEMQMQFSPQVLSWSLNNGADIILSPGTTTAVYATGTISDANGYADIVLATSTLYRSALGSSCTADNNNCYHMGTSSCSLSACSGNTCDISCRADVYFFADPTDVGTFSAQDWRADVLVEDASGSSDTQSTFGSELLTLRALEVTSSIAYGALAVTEDTGSNDATTTIENIGNDAIDVSLSGTDLSDGASSVIPVSYQKYATSTFTYNSCVFCTPLSTLGSSYEVDLSKPTTTTPVLSDDVYWGIAIPYGVSAAPHTGVNTFMAIGDS